MSEQIYPEPTCGALIFNPKGQIFLMRSYKWKDKYVIPGGHIELGEKMPDTVKREVKEETGMDIRDIEFICFQEFIFGDECWKKKHFIFFDFACETDSAEVTLNSEGQEFIWTGLQEALKLPVEPYTMHVIKEYMKLRVK
ncbi:MAG: NUDIX domain-containing protein [Candidatus Paceibacterota bacterium]|jgi:nucleoside triphosphatase